MDFPFDIAIAIYAFFLIIGCIILYWLKKKEIQDTGPDRASEIQPCPVPDQPVQTDVVIFPQNKKCPMCAELIKFAAKKCRYCGEYLSDNPNEPTVQTASQGGSWLKILLGGGILCLGAFITFAAFNASTSVDNFGQDAYGQYGNHKVHNIGLMNDRTVGIMIGLGLLVTGAIVIKK
ncbi:MAG: hypothetical protein WA705_00860 [Candidatus Ozemobacteraceae bacterium]